MVWSQNSSVSFYSLAHLTFVDEARNSRIYERRETPVPAKDVAGLKENSAPASQRVCFAAGISVSLRNYLRDKQHVSSGRQTELVLTNESAQT